mgnify:FL=1|tara:strand:- start:645 stop:1346 length:702 start_codon:yes stop_codon:yes gene_type:complete
MSIRRTNIDRVNEARKSTIPTIGRGEPINSQGSEGDIAFRRTGSGLKLYIKANQQWHGVKVGESFKSLEEKINEVKAKVDVMNQFKLPANPTFNTLTASSVNTSAYTYNTNTCTQQVTNDVQDSYSFVSSLGGGKIFSIAGFDNTFSKLTIYEQGGSAQDDYLQFLVSANGQTSIFTADASGSEADLTITADGDLTLKCANSKSIVFNQGRNASGAHLKSNFINPFIASAIFG